VPSGVTAQRIIVAGATTSVTRRCTLRKAFLAPWDERVVDARLYAMAYAQRQTGVAIHHSVDVITHSHTNVTPSQSNLPEFVRQMNHDTSCALNTLLAMERYDSPRELFDGREPHYLRLMDAPAQAAHLVYEHVNNVAAGLVERPAQMPGHVFDFGLWKTGGFWVERPDFFFGETRPERIFLHVTPPPLLYRAFGGDLDALIHHMRRLADDAARAIRDARKRPALGAREVQRIHPWSEPNTLRESGGTDQRTFKYGAKDLLGRENDILGAMEVTGFRGRYQDARQAQLAGDLEHHYPFGTYGPCVYHNAPAELAPLAGARVAMPGPTLEQVQAELEREGRERGRGSARDRVEAHDVVDEVREVFEREAPDLVAESPMHVSRPPSVQTGDESNPDDEGVHVRRRRDRRRKPRAGEARRIVTLRDARRGRPPKRRAPDEDDRGSTKHGSDPPS